MGKVSFYRNQYNCTLRSRGWYGSNGSFRIDLELRKINEELRKILHGVLEGRKDKLTKEEYDRALELMNENRFEEEELHKILYGEYFEKIKKRKRKKYTPVEVEKIIKELDEKVKKMGEMMDSRNI